MPGDTGSEATPWSVHDLEEGVDRRFEIGPLGLRVRWIAGELWLAHARTEDEGTRDDGTIQRRTGPDTPEALLDEPEEWARWSAGGDGVKLRLTPVFPDRPLVVGPEHSFHLLRGARVGIYIRVPLWVRVELLGRQETVVTEIPTLVLSDTWFGDVTEGELCYYLPTTARREVTPELFEPHLAICPLQLSNPSEDDLAVEKIALRVAHLSIFGRGDELWSDRTRVQYRGEAIGSDLRITGRPPEEAPGAELITPPRTPMGRGLRARTFAQLRHMPGLGFSF